MMNVTLRLGQASCARARVDTNASATESVRPAIGFIDLLLDSRTQKQIPCRSSVAAALAHYASGQLRVGTTSASPNRSRVQGPKVNIATHSAATTPLTHASEAKGRIATTPASTTFPSAEVAGNAASFAPASATSRRWRCSAALTSRSCLSFATLRSSYALATAARDRLH